MKYSESSRKSRFAGSAAFYIIIACCLIAVGGASWFALSNINKKENPSSDISSKSNQSNIISSEIGPSSKKSLPSESADVAKPVKDQPYESSEVNETVSDIVADSFMMPVTGSILKSYNDKELQYSSTYGDMRIHTGTDIACEKGTAVSACGNGRVLSIEESSLLGNVITIDHGNGITVKYANIKDSKLKVNDKVSIGDIIGNADTVPSECADKSHLHIEVFKNGNAVAPDSFLGIN